MRNVFAFVKVVLLNVLTIGSKMLKICVTLTYAVH